jgi:hypothetical protein
MFGSFKSQIKELERTMWKEIQNIERALEIRTKRVDHLEKMISTRAAEEREQAAAGVTRPNSRSVKDEQYTKLKNENKLLKAEVQILRNSSPNGRSVPDRGSSHRSRDNSLMRHYSTSLVEDTASQHSVPARVSSPVAVDPTVTVPSLPPNSHIPLRNTSPTPRRASHHAGVHTRQSSTSTTASSLQPSEQRWVHRLKELERRLKHEREARLLDRSGARKRIEESEAEKERLRIQLEHELERRQSLEDEGGRDSVEVFE